MTGDKLGSGCPAWTAPGLFVREVFPEETMVQGRRKSSRPPGTSKGRVTTWSPGAGATPGTCLQGLSAAPTPPHWPGQRPRAQAATLPRQQEATFALRNARTRLVQRPHHVLEPRLLHGFDSGDVQDLEDAGRTCGAGPAALPWLQVMLSAGDSGGSFRGGACSPEVRGRPGPWRRSASSACFSGQCPVSRPGARARSSGPASRRPTSCPGLRPAEGKRASTQSAGISGRWGGGSGVVGAGLVAGGSQRWARAWGLLAVATPGRPGCGPGLRGRPEDPVR